VTGVQTCALPILRSSIFEIFDRGGKGMSGAPGMGVGLSIVAQFAALHGGRAWVEDAPGGGASFRVLLPGCVVQRAVDDEPRLGR